MHKKWGENNQNSSKKVGDKKNVGEKKIIKKVEKKIEKIIGKKVGVKKNIKRVDK